jgi:CDP-paratose 2-epimerase
MMMPPLAPTPAADLDGATIVVTGGAGFVGSALAMHLKRGNPGARVVAIDNLRRAGSELRPPDLRDVGVEFVHGDIRNPDDLELGGLPVDLLVECSAEPSVLAGYSGSPRYVLDTNLVGTINCLELARERKARVLFMSTSRVYPMARVNALNFTEEPTRFALSATQSVPGASAQGVAESFPLDGVRTFYGTTKLASEMLLEEYAAAFGLEFVTLRFGVISGPGQMGKVEQGVFSLWMARHLWGDSLTYKGWGGVGKQVRDVVHIDDVRELADRVLEQWQTVRGKTLNAGGGCAVSASLHEATALCQEITGRTLRVAHVPETHQSDVRVYLTDHSALTGLTGWRPRRDVRQVLLDLEEWMTADARRLKPILAG